MLSILSRWLIHLCLYLSLASCIPEISSSFHMTSLLILKYAHTKVTNNLFQAIHEETRENSINVSRM